MAQREAEWHAVVDHKNIGGSPVTNLRVKHPVPTAEHTPDTAKAKLSDSCRRNVNAATLHSALTVHDASLSAKIVGNQRSPSSPPSWLVGMVDELLASPERETSLNFLRGGRKDIIRCRPGPASTSPLSGSVCNSRLVVDPFDGAPPELCLTCFDSPCACSTLRQRNKRR
eukprot:CAMPEP_0115883718 /NCGR_PEP_ID=MMETSP0287-20121206/29719_1 /TAXON_ID=412157 /ORGANISM="Chrysochromulina rotalis, Strain UIO044" /LENGTH=169 /DNA_ID=CAMNT_0003339945 /DNA_START=87 /DNA_END=596 /DNA_ORIENTATION=+